MRNRPLHRRNIDHLIEVCLEEILRKNEIVSNQTPCKSPSAIVLKSLRLQILYLELAHDNSAIRFTPNILAVAVCGPVAKRIFVN